MRLNKKLHLGHSFVSKGVSYRRRKVHKWLAVDFHEKFPTPLIWFFIFFNEYFSQWCCLLFKIPPSIIFNVITICRLCSLANLKYQTAHKKLALMALQIAASVLDLYYFNAAFSISQGCFMQIFKLRYSHKQAAVTFQ